MDFDSFAPAKLALAPKITVAGTKKRVQAAQGMCRKISTGAPRMRR